MYTLHYAPDNASLMIRLLLEELGVPYNTILVDRSANAQQSPEYRALNPRGLIPVLITPDGPIFESAAILLWLSDRHSALAPAATDAQRGQFLSWLFYASNGLHTDLRHLFYPAQYKPADCNPSAYHTTISARLNGHLTHFEALGAKGVPWFNAPRISSLDYYMCCMLRWMALFPRGQTDWFRLADWPNLHALAISVETRPAAQRAAISEGLGPTPFSAPAHATPPEGSAT